MLRVTPLQKAQVVQLVKAKVQGSITLAIGDGANDVSMIQVRNNIMYIHMCMCAHTHAHTFILYCFLGCSCWHWDQWFGGSPGNPGLRLCHCTGAYTDDVQHSRQHLLILSLLLQFRYLVKLLFVHGAWNYRRLTNVILYSFYKNICLYLMQVCHHYLLPLIILSYACSYSFGLHFSTDFLDRFSSRDGPLVLIMWCVYMCLYFNINVHTNLCMINA